LELKSEKVQMLISKILSNLISPGDSFLIQTTSLIVNHYVMNSSNLINQLNLQNNVFNIASFCDLTNNINTCSNKFITIKVNSFVKLNLKLLLVNYFLIIIKVNINSNGNKWT
jgi:hypothetical protein